MPVYMGSRFSLRAGARVRGSTRGSTRGPRGPKKNSFAAAKYISEKYHTCNIPVMNYTPSHHHGSRCEIYKFTIP